MFESEINRKIELWQNPMIWHKEFPELQQLRIASCCDVKDVKKFRASHQQPEKPKLLDKMRQSVLNNFQEMISSFQDDKVIDYTEEGHCVVSPKPAKRVWARKDDDIVVRMIKGDINMKVQDEDAVKEMKSYWSPSRKGWRVKNTIWVLAY